MNKILFNLLFVGVSLGGIQGAFGMEVEGKNIKISKKRKSDFENKSQAFQRKNVSRKLYGGSTEADNDIFDGYFVGAEQQENPTEVALDAIAYANYPQKNTNPYATSRPLTAICLNDPIVTAQLVHRYNTRSTAKEKNNFSK